MKKTTKKLTFQVPNSLICNDMLSYSTRRLGAVLYSRRNAQGSCCKSLQQLSELSGCAIATVQKGLQALQETGYITIHRRYRYSETHERRIYDRFTYECSLDRLNQGGYTLMPRDIFAHGETVSHATFVVLMYIHQQAGNTNRAFPSINRMSHALGMAHSSVCRAIRVVKGLACFLVHYCIKQNGAFACNSYHLVSTAVSFVEAVVDGAVAVGMAVISASKGCSSRSYCSKVGGGRQESA